MFGQAQGQKENPILAKPSQTLRGNAIFDRRICETGNGERGMGTGNITAPCGGLRPMGKQTRRAERVPRELGTGNGRVAAKFEQVLRLLRTSSPLAENKFKSCGEQVHFHEGKFPIREERKKDETETT